MTETFFPFPHKINFVFYKKSLVERTYTFSLNLKKSFAVRFSGLFRNSFFQESSGFSIFSEKFTKTTNGEKKKERNSVI